MNAIQKKLLIENECKKCVNFVEKNSLGDIGCHIEAYRNHYTNNYQHFQFCEEVLKKKGITKPL